MEECKEKGSRWSSTSFVTRFSFAFLALCKAVLRLILSSSVELITATLQSSGSLLFPVDPSTRLIELLILLDQHWSYSMNQAASQGRNWTYPLCIVSRTGRQMIDLARGLMEWMGGGVASGEAAGDGGVGRGRNAGEMRGHPLEFR
jgi:hypothetical protein